MEELLSLHEAVAKANSDLIILYPNYLHAGEAS